MKDFKENPYIKNQASMIYFALALNYFHFVDKRFSVFCGNRQTHRHDYCNPRWSNVNYNIIIQENFLSVTKYINRMLVDSIIINIGGGWISLAP